MTVKFHQHLLDLYKDEDVSKQLEDYEYSTDLEYTPADDKLHRIINLSDDFKLESIGRLNGNNKFFKNSFRMAFKK